MPIGKTPAIPSAPSPRIGYALAATAATLWALNGSLARFLLDDGVGALALAQMRAFVSVVLLFGALAVVRPQALRVDRRDIPSLAFLGIAGLAAVHVTYFLAIDRLQIGAALTIQYLGPLLILVWLRFAHGRHLRPGLWAAAALSVAGCFLVVRAYDAGALDPLGLAAAGGSAVAFAIYLVASERENRRHPPLTILAWALGFASAFWIVVQPPWSFPFGDFASPSHLALALGVAVVGTLLPFICMVSALRHIPAPRAGVVATLEPLLAAIIAWAVHDEALAAIQIAGGMAVVVAVIWVQIQRISTESEAAPVQMSR
jgi:drug/metabolite transporter (DMT)-like permease